ncbi:Vacuolar morphogenesis protein 6 [Podospora pseudocomata]|uniref:Vacuolar morphogenesis protein 6 n=1 Tax=Podospora pseudocomata TaxID=2093779 RepID=A0ABR0GJ21_9PEZI|nr:Vacuolar morphogenesis protein 6 [Podospora pseudocomata]
MLMMATDPSFYEAHAVVLSNMGQHRQALVIYVFKMKDYAKAEEYCNHIHKTQDLPPSSSPDQNDTDNTDQPSIYHTLLSLYLRPPRPHKPNLGPALDLLSKHGSRLPATSTLSLVPDDLPVAQLESYFRGRMRSANSMVNETRVVAGLRRTSHLAAQALLYLGDGIPGGQAGRNRRVVVGEERMCGGCHKRPMSPGSVRSGDGGGLKNWGRV